MNNRQDLYVSGRWIRDDDAQDLLPPRTAVERKLRRLGCWVISSNALFYDEAAKDIGLAEAQLAVDLNLSDFSVKFPVVDYPSMSAVLFLARYYFPLEFGPRVIAVIDDMTGRYMKERMPEFKDRVIFEPFEYSSVDEERRLVRNNWDDTRFIGIAKRALTSLQSLPLWVHAPDAVKKYVGPPEEFRCRKSGLAMVNPAVEYTVSGEPHNLGPDLLVNLFGELRVNTGATGYTGSTLYNFLSHEELIPDHKTELRHVVPNLLLKNIILKWSEQYLEGKSGLRLDGLAKEFKCPISGAIMDRATLFSISGRTYDESSTYEAALLNKEQLFKINPVSGVRVDNVFVSNDSIRNLISRWRRGEGYAHISSEEDRQVLDKVEGYVQLWLHSYIVNVLEDLRAQPKQLPLFKELRVLTRLYSCSSVFDEIIGSFELLFSPSFLNVYRSNPPIFNEAVALVGNICNYFPAVERQYPLLIHFLIEALRVAISSETRGYAAGALHYLSRVEELSEKIGKLGALKPLIDLIDRGNPIDSCQAGHCILSLCKSPINRSRLLLVPSFYDCLLDAIYPPVISVLLKILVLLSEHGLGKDEVFYRGALPRLFMILKETEDREDLTNCLTVIFRAFEASWALAVEEIKGLVIEKELDVIGILLAVSTNIEFDDAATELSAVLVSKLTAAGCWI